MFSRLHVYGPLCFGLMLIPQMSHAQGAAEICVETGACASVEPITALMIIGVQTLVDEINKGDDGFGPNGAVVNAVNTVLGDLQRGGLGPNNDIVKAWETIRNDLTNGMGPNNDIVKFFESLNIKL